MNRYEFKQQLSQHDLSVNQFLDLRDEWCKLPAADRLALLEEDADASTSAIQINTSESCVMEMRHNSVAEHCS